MLESLSLSNNSQALRDLSMMIDKEQEVPIPLSEVKRVDILLLETLTLILVDRLERRLSIDFPKRSERYAALIAFLATNGNCTRQVIQERLYSQLSNKQNSFDTDKRRIMRDIQETALAQGMILAASLFKNGRNARGDAVWRLNTLCHVDQGIEQQLQQYHMMILAVQAGRRTLNLEELREIGNNAMQFHGVGYLGNHSFKKPYWSWAKEPFLNYRRMCLTIVTELAAQEYRAGKQEQEEKERNQYLRRAAKYYIWCMETAIHGVFNLKEAEMARERALSIYSKDLKDTKAAEKVRRTFEKSRKLTDVEEKAKENEE